MGREIDFEGGEPKKKQELALTRDDILQSS